MTFEVWVPVYLGACILYISAAKLGSTIGGTPTIGSTSLAPNKWYHAVVTKSGTTLTVYLDGIQDGTSTKTAEACDGNIRFGISGVSSAPLKGELDEVAIWNRALSANEVRDLYLRGAVRLKYQTRFCDDSGCDTEAFIGPDGTIGTYFSELNNSALTTPSLSFSSFAGVDNLNGPGRFFQYKAFTIF